MTHLVSGSSRIRMSVQYPVVASTLAPRNEHILTLLTARPTLHIIQHGILGIACIQTGEN